jgi:hypothetical protein
LLRVCDNGVPYVNIGGQVLVCAHNRGIYLPSEISIVLPGR